MVKNNVRVDLEHDMEPEVGTKPFKTTNVFGKLKRSADYNYLYKKAYKKYIKATKKLAKKNRKSKDANVE
jgi:hypothetical protein